MPSASNSRCCGSVASTTGSKLPGSRARLTSKVHGMPTLTALAVSNGGSDEREHAINKTRKVDDQTVANTSCLSSLLKNPRHGESVVIQFSVTNRRRLACGAHL